MKSTIRIFILAAVAMLALTLLALFIVVICQNPLVRAIYNLDESYLSYFALPLAPIIRTLFMLAITIVLCIFINNQKLGIVFEIIFLALAVIILPLMVYGVNVLQPILIGTYKGAYHMAKTTSVTQLCSYASALYPVAQALCFVACGMSIGCKCNKKLPQ